MLNNFAAFKSWHGKNSINSPMRKHFFSTQAERYGPCSAGAVHKRIAEVALKSNKLLELAQHGMPQRPGTSLQNKPSGSRRPDPKNFSNIGKPSLGARVKIPCRLLSDRLESPSFAFGLPNFTKQTAPAASQFNILGLCNLFSYVNLKLNK